MNNLQLDTGQRKITILAAKLRLTKAERIQIRTLAQSNPDVEDFIDLLNSSLCVDLSRPYFAEGVKNLVLSGVITEQRMNEILFTNIAEHEIYRGI